MEGTPACSSEPSVRVSALSSARFGLFSLPCWHGTAVLSILIREERASSGTECRSYAYKEGISCGSDRRYTIVKRTSHLLAATPISIVHRPSISMFASDTMLSNDVRRSLLSLSVARCDTDDRDHQQHALPPSPPSVFMRCSFGRQTEIDGGVHHQEVGYRGHNFLQCLS